MPAKKSTTKKKPAAAKKSATKPRKANRYANFTKAKWAAEKQKAVRREFKEMSAHIKKEWSKMSETEKAKYA